mmetsp:Transcript_14305/g.16717  ORF Transcript_14305/g.16717 Transcript_14305/m.16717 type:complete len:90 (-) Transcript_14305:22-291(-)
MQDSFSEFLMDQPTLRRMTSCLGFARRQAKKNHMVEVIYPIDVAPTDAGGLLAVPALPALVNIFPHLLPAPARDQQRVSEFPRKTIWWK